MSVLIAMEGVLRDGPKFVREGRLLVDALLGAQKRVVFMSDEPIDKAEHWLSRNGIFGYAGVLSPSVAVDPDEPLRERQIAVARTVGHVDLVVDANPEVIKHCLDERIPSLLFAHPETLLPEWHPDTAVKPWGDITSQLERKKDKEAKRE